MRWIPISEARTGLVLGEPVLDSSGHILAKKGESLSSDLLGILQASGIRDILATEMSGAEGQEASTAPAFSQEEHEIACAVRVKLEVRFRRYPDQPIMQTLRNLAEKRLTQARSAGQPN